MRSGETKIKAIHKGIITINMMLIIIINVKPSVNVFYASNGRGL